MVKINEKNQLLLNPLGAIQNGFRGVFSKVSPRFSVKDMRKEKRINKTVNIYYQDQQLLGEWTVNKTVNISNEGACIIVDHPLIKGKGIILEIGHVNHGHRQVMRIIGTIVDVSKRDGSGYLCRIVFKQKSTRMHQKKNFL